MFRPVSVQRFEQVFFINLAIGIVLTFINWPAMLVELRAGPESALYLAIGQALQFCLLLAFWFFIARKASRIALWIYGVLFALNFISIGMSLAMGRMDISLLSAQGILAFLLTGVGIWFLMRPDAQEWFARKGKSDTPDTGTPPSPQA